MKLPLPERIRYVRLTLRLIQKDFGRLAGVGRNNANHWEAGRRAPTREQAAALAAATDYPLAVFVALKARRRPPVDVAELESRVTALERAFRDTRP